MNYRNASTADLKEIKELLIACKLPFDDIGDHIDNLVLIEEKGGIIAIGCLEVYKTIGLVRSIVVGPKKQGKGIGRLIYQSIEDKARKFGLTALYLLTESAQEYFSRLGYMVKERADAPPSIKNTQQFKSLCPATAILMFKTLPVFDK